MRIEHFALYATNLEIMKDFYTKYFRAKAGNMYHNEKTGFKSYFLSFDDGARLELMTKPGLETISSGEHYGYAHIAISTGSKQAVDALTELLKKDGYRVLSGPRTTGDGYYESCISDPEDNIIEITA